MRRVRHQTAPLDAARFRAYARPRGVDRVLDLVIEQDEY